MGKKELVTWVTVLIDVGAKLLESMVPTGSMVILLLLCSIPIMKSASIEPDLVSRSDKLLEDDMDFLTITIFEYHFLYIFRLWMMAFGWS